MGACGIARRRTIPEGILPAANAGLVAVMDVNEASVKEVADEFGAKPFTDIEGVLNDPGVDAVYIATPNSLHRDLAIAAAGAGKHVLCEKPLANRSADIREMIAACEKANVLLGVGFMMRFNVYHRKIREMLQDGTLGVPVLVRGQMTCWYPPIDGAWRQVPEGSGGGAMADMGSHVVDVIEMLLGRTKRVTAHACNRVHDYPVEDTCVAILESESGAVGVVDASFGIPDEASEFVLEVYGSSGAVKGKYTLSQGSGGSVRACLLAKSGAYDAQQAVEVKGGFAPLELEIENTYKAEIEGFSRAILDGTPAPVSGQDGLWNHLVIEAIYESARTGRGVELSTG